MNVTLRLDGGPLRRWILVLIDRIAAQPGLHLTIDRPPPPPHRLRPEDALLHAEALLARRRLDGWAASVDGGPPVRAAPSGADLVIDLQAEAPASEARHWRLTFEGRTGEGALLAALVAGRSPLVALEQDEAVVASARVGTEAHGDLLTTIEDALARTVTLILVALHGLRPVVDASPEAPPPLTFGRVAAQAVGRGGTKLGRAVTRLRYRHGHWRVGWRRIDGPDLIDTRAMPAAGWTDLPDDGSCFYADPFPLARDGRTFLFVEDYRYDRAKGIVSAVEFGPDGPLGAPVPVLEEPHHLSYPFVFERDGACWMIPESCAAGTVDLYRATAFPGGWVKEATLLSGVVASDATLVEHGGRWWMMATVRDDTPGLPPRGSTSDALHLWSASDFRGPWTAHPRNPVLIDVASARSAGRIVRRGGALVRPVQDCRLGYGAALALARIDRLDGEGYAQTVETRLAPGPGWAGTGLHTLNRCGAFEFIDGLGRVRRTRR